MASRPQTAVDRLVTRLPEDAGYAERQDVPTGPRKGLPVYVCPRADDHGRRDGFIPPGVAAVRGLIPRTGLRHVSNQSVGREAAGDGLTEAERYRRYYGKALPQQQPAAPARRAPQPPPLTPEDVFCGQEEPPAARTVTRTAPRTVKKAVARPQAKSPVRTVPGGSRASAAVPKTRSKPAKSRAVPVLRGRAVGADDGTLEGFYDSLGGPAPGTREGSAEERESLAAARGERLPPPPPPRVQGDPCEAEVAELRRAIDVANSAIGEQQELIERLNEELEDLRGQQSPEPVVHETVRVQLAAEPEKLKLGGRGWECRVLGHLDFGREGRSAVLTVTDPGYASGLMAEIQVGELVILHGRERTACEYAGECAKLYGDQDGADFIAVFRFSLAGSGE